MCKHSFIWMCILSGFAQVSKNFITMVSGSYQSSNKSAQCCIFFNEYNV